MAVSLMRRRGASSGKESSMKKQLFSAVLAVFLLCILCPAASAAYKDVPDTCWSYADITEATNAGIFKGTSATVFDRKSNISRAQFVTAMGRLFGWDSVSPETPTYTDCDASRWYYSAVETAHANGALPTYTTAFRPNAPITREEMASMLVRALGYNTLAGKMSTVQLPFTDITSNRGYIAVAYDLGIINGTTADTFAPKGSATREQAAVMLMRVYRKLHAVSIELPAEGEAFIPVRVSSPAPRPDTPIPSTPLEPLEELYKILHMYREAGTDLNKLALVLTAGGIATTTQGSRILSSEVISKADVLTHLAADGTAMYYSEQHQSAYLTRGSSLTIWYQSEASLAAKLQLARMFGINHFILEDVSSEPQS